MPEPKNSKGRPKGAKNSELGQVLVVAQCPLCKSSDRERYRLVAVIEHGGVTSTGFEYSHTVKRRTRCKTPGCLKVRTDTFLENSAPQVNPGEENEPGESIDDE